MGKRYNTPYTGVFYRLAKKQRRKGQEKVYYIVFQKDGITVEEKVGRQFKDNMTPAKASKIRADCMDGKRLPRREIAKHNGKIAKLSSTGFLPQINTTCSISTPLNLSSVVAESPDKEHGVSADVLQQATVYLKDLFEDKQVLVVLKDIEGCVVGISHWYKNQIHHKWHLDKKATHEIFPVKCTERYLYSDQRVLESGNFMEFEEKIPIDDILHSAISFKFPVFDLNAEVCGVCAISTASGDSDEVGRVHRASLRVFRALFNLTVMDSETNYRAIFDNANEFIFLLNGNSFIECNKKATEFFACGSEKLIGKAFYDFSPKYQPDGALSIEKGTKKTLLALQGIPQLFEWKHCTADGKLFDAEVSLNRIMLKGKVFIQSIGRDITKRKRAEESLRSALSEIEQLKQQIEADNIYLREEIKLTHNFEEIVGQSKALKNALMKVEQVAPTDATVLILGETGTGKELIARAVHNASLRKERPLIKVNCATLPATLIESALFGHEKGAFTGAVARQEGRFELADCGTLFLDEVGEMPPELQVKLLRVIQEGEFERVGGSKTVKVNVRIIAATNRNLRETVDSGQFREDLWFRLNVFPINLPALRERKEDIPLLVNAFVLRYARKLSRKIKTITAREMKMLQEYSWPGNVRELENVIERSLITTTGPTLRLADALDTFEPIPKTENSLTLEEMERAYILNVLEKTHWRVAGPEGAALILGLHPATLRSRMRKLGIRKSHGKP